MATKVSLPTRTLDELFGRLHAILGSKFMDLFNGAKMDLVREEWGRALADFKPVEINRGMDEVAKRRFIPTLGEFANFCRPCLDPEWAYREAEHCLRQRDGGAVGDWSHPAVWRAASTMSLEVRGGNYKACASRWAFTLKTELARGWGQQPPPPPLVLSDQTKTSGNSPVAKVHRAKIAALLGREPPDATQDA